MAQEGNGQISVPVGARLVPVHGPRKPLVVQRPCGRAGGSAQVFSCFDPDRGTTPVAAKVLSPQYALFSWRARDEARILASIIGTDAGFGSSEDDWVNTAMARARRERSPLPGHAYVVRFFDAFDAWVRDPDGRLVAGFFEPTVVIVMELGEHSLADEIAWADGPMEEARARLLMADAVAGVRCAHQVCWHNDLKPANFVMVGNTLKLADFGLATAFGDKTHGLADHVSEHYAAPERLVDRIVSGGGDVYSLGLIYAEMRTGVRPNYGHLRVEIPIEAEQAMVSECTKADRRSRLSLAALGAVFSHPTAGEVDHYVQGPDPDATRTAYVPPPSEPIPRPAPTSSKATPPSRWTKNPKIVGSVVVACLLAAALIAVLLVGPGGHGPSSDTTTTAVGAGVVSKSGNTTTTSTAATTTTSTAPPPTTTTTRAEVPAVAPAVAATTTTAPSQYTVTVNEIMPQYPTAGNGFALNGGDTGSAQSVPGGYSGYFYEAADYSGQCSGVDPVAGTWQIAGIPAGNYSIEAYIPFASNLGSVDYNVDASQDIVINQSSEAGQWVVLFNVPTIPFPAGGQEIEVSLTDYPSGQLGQSQSGPCQPSGQEMVWDAMRFTLY